MRSRAWRALPWSAAIGGVSLAAWSLLRTRGPCPHDGGKHVPVAYSEDQIALISTVTEAVVRAYRDQEPAGDDRPSMRVALGAVPGLVQPAWVDPQFRHDFPAAARRAVKLNQLALQRR